MNAQVIQYDGFRACPASPVLGAEVKGLDLGEPILESVARSLRQAFVDHLLLVFHDQQLSPADQCRFAEVFGELTQYPFLRSLPDHPMVTPVIRESWDSGVFGRGWHTDTVYLPHPSKATMLYAKEVPESGGETLFANMYLAFEALDAATKQDLQGLEGRFTSAKVHTVGGDYWDSAGRNEDRVEAPEIVAGEVRHPLVREHPESGRASLYLSPPHISSIVGLDEAKSRVLIDDLSDHVASEEFCFKLQWRPGMLAIWDNRCLLHRPLDNYPGRRRVMHRVSIKGDRPVGARVGEDVVRQ